MSDQQNTTESPQNPAPNGPEGPEGPEPDPRNAEAAQWRRRLRDAEAELEAVTAERDALQAQVTEARHAKVRDALKEALRGLSDEGVETVISAADLERFLTDGDEVDADKVASYAAPFAGPASRGPRNRRAWTTGPKHATAPSSSAEASWGSVLKPQ